LQEVNLLGLGLFFSIWTVVSIIGGKIAQNKGRSFWKAWALCMLLNPLIGIIVALALNRYKNCQFCAEYVKPEATLCKHCGKDQAFEGVE